MSPPSTPRWVLAATLGYAVLASSFCLPGPAAGYLAEPVSVAGGYSGDPKLSVDVASLSISEGGRQRFVIDAGSAYAGHEYQMVGSASGVFPGTLVDTIMVPLNYDAYSELLLEIYRKAPCVRFSGRLDKDGRAYPELNVAKGTQNLATNRVYYHAAVIWDAKKQDVINASNAVELMTLP